LLQWFQNHKTSKGTLVLKQLILQQFRQILIELDKKLPIKRKNPTTAGLLAIIPGAGIYIVKEKGMPLYHFF